MSYADETCWSIVRGAARGEREHRRDFAHAYLPIIRAYLGARWRATNRMADLDDAVQDAFVDCFREGGALGRVDPDRNVRFRTFLYGVVRNVALRYEERAGRRREVQPPSGMTEAVPDGEENLSKVFDRAWAKALVQRARERQAREAEAAGPDAQRRVELLELRFGEGLPIRDIATRWGEDAAVLHRQYRKARQEFQAALEAEVAFHSPGTPAEIRRECQSLLDLL